MDARLVPLAVGEEFSTAGRRRELCAAGFASPLPELRTPADRLDRDGFDHQFLAAVDESELRLVRSFEGRLHRGERAALYDQRRVGAGIADVRAHMHLDGFRRHTLAGDLAADFPGEAP